jgi:threonine dehydratase
VEHAIADEAVSIALVHEEEIRKALKDLFETQALVVEPSSAVTLAFVQARAKELEEPICVILTGENIAREDHRRLISAARAE